MFFVEEQNDKNDIENKKATTDVNEQQNSENLNVGTKEIERKGKSHFLANESLENNKTEGKNSSKKNFIKAKKNFKNDQKRVVEFEEKIIDIARVTTVVKGGRRFSFSAIVIVGNKKGKVGIGHGKANEVPDAIKKAVKNAQNNLIDVPIVNKSTIPHEIKAKYLASKILLKPAPKGKGIVASGSVRAVVELAGITDIYTKSYGSRTKQNTAKAVIKALKMLKTAEQVASLRDINVETLLNK